MAVDGLHFVMSRTALLDLVLMFFVLAAFGCLLVDRDRARARLRGGAAAWTRTAGSARTRTSRSPSAGLAPVAAGGRALPGPGRRHQVERPVLPGVLLRP